jgi:endonuclease III
MTQPRLKNWQQQHTWTIEHIEQPVGKDLSDQGESLLREKLRAQIGSNASVEEIKQTISEINMVLDKAENLLKSCPSASTTTS